MLGEDHYMKCTDKQASKKGTDKTKPLRSKIFTESKYDL